MIQSNQRTSLAARAPFSSDMKEVSLDYSEGAQNTLILLEMSMGLVTRHKNWGEKVESSLVTCDL